MKLRNAIAAFGVASAMAVGAASPALAETTVDDAVEDATDGNDEEGNNGLWGLAGLAGLLGLLGLRKRPTDVGDRTVTRTTGTGSSTGTNR